jgi:UDP-3-O-[3-hydroxymyristoyl] glucosamine N-acyltransferase
MKEHCLVFAKAYNPEWVIEANSYTNILCIVSEEYRGLLTCPHVCVARPRLIYAKIYNQFFRQTHAVKRLAETAKISKMARIGHGVSIGEFSVIGDDVVIGDNCTIRNHVVISGPCVIGEGSYIKSHAVIGEEGFGFEREENGVAYMIPQVGGVRIGKNCLIGSFTCINRGTINDTLIGDNVMLDDHVFIGHNADCRNNVTVTGCANIGAGNTLMDGVWIGPQAALMNGDVVIAKNAMVGLGAVVLKSVPEGKVAFGNPARALWDRESK